jgi:hypothetical protein
MAQLPAHVLKQSYTDLTAPALSQLLTAIDFVLTETTWPDEGHSEA